MSWWAARRAAKKEWKRYKERVELTKLATMAEDVKYVLRPRKGRAWWCGWSSMQGGRIAADYRCEVSTAVVEHGKITVVTWCGPRRRGAPVCLRQRRLPGGGISARASSIDGARPRQGIGAPSVSSLIK